MGLCGNTSELNECQNTFALTLAVLNTHNKDKIYEFNHRPSQGEAWKEDESKCRS
jgi:hypothetical protein